MGESPTHHRQVAALLPFSILRYLGRAVGRAEAERVRVASGERQTMDELSSRGAWSAVASTIAIGAGASELTGDAQIGRRGGEELFRVM
jgi:hypothetical protein